METLLRDLNNVENPSSTTVSNIPSEEEQERLLKFFQQLENLKSSDPVEYEKLVQEIGSALALQNPAAVSRDSANPSFDNLKDEVQRLRSDGLLGEAWREGLNLPGDLTLDEKGVKKKVGDSISFLDYFDLDFLNSRKEL